MPSSSVHRMMPFLLLLCLYGFGLSLIFELGGYKSFLHIAVLPFIWILVRDGGRLPLPKPYWWMLGIGGIFLVQGGLMVVNPIEGDHDGVLAWSMFTVTLIFLAPGRVGERIGHSELIGLISILFVIVQVGAYFWRANAYLDGEFQGSLSNPHYLAMYAAMGCWFLIYLMRRYRGWVSLLLVAIWLINLWVLALTRSVPAFLGVLAAIGVLLLYWSPRGIVLLITSCLLGILVTYATIWVDLLATVNATIIFFQQDERWILWREFWILQEASTWLQWWFGHGFGQYLNDYMPVSSFHAKLVAPYFDFASPHNYILELLYSHGLVGIGLFVFAYGLWFWTLHKSIKAAITTDQRLLGFLLLALIVGQLVLGFFTMPFFSRRNLYPVAVLLGVSLRYIATCQPLADQ